MYVFICLSSKSSAHVLGKRGSVKVESQEIAAATLHKALPTYAYLYTVPFLSLYPLLAYAYYIKYDDWLQSEEWTFLACTTLGVGHALSFLVTKWSTGARAWITTRKVRMYTYVTIPRIDLSFRNPVK